MEDRTTNPKLTPAQRRVFDAVHTAGMLRLRAKDHNVAKRLAARDVLGFHVDTGTFYVIGSGALEALEAARETVRANVAARFPGATVSVSFGRPGSVACRFEADPRFVVIVDASPYDHPDECKIAIHFTGPRARFYLLR